MSDGQSSEGWRGKPPAVGEQERELESLPAHTHLLAICSTRSAKGRVDRVLPPPSARHQPDRRPVTPSAPCLAVLSPPKQEYQRERNERQRDAEQHACSSRNAPREKKKNMGFMG